MSHSGSRGRTAIVTAFLKRGICFNIGFPGLCLFPVVLKSRKTLTCRNKDLSLDSPASKPASSLNQSLNNGCPDSGWVERHRVREKKCPLEQLKSRVAEVSSCVKHLKQDSTRPSKHGCVQKLLETKKVCILVPQYKVSPRV